MYCMSNFQFSIFNSPLLKLPALVFDLPFLYFGKKVSRNEIAQVIEKIKPGDIILCADNIFPLWQLVVKATGGSNYSHVGMYEGYGRVIEATTFHQDGSSVVKTNIRNFIGGYKSVCIVRPPYLTENERNNAVTFALSQLGKPYDYKLNLNNDNALYCTELIAKSLKTTGIVTPTTTFCRQKYYMPDNFLKIAEVNIVHGNPVNFRMMILPHLLFAIFQTSLFFFTSLSFLICGMVTLTYILGGYIQHLQVTGILNKWISHSSLDYYIIGVFSGLFY
jgi:Uncharacterized distant relative of cell wall-associated hydrolases